VKEIIMDFLTSWLLGGLFVGGIACGIVFMVWITTLK